MIPLVLGVVLAAALVWSFLRRRTRGRQPFAQTGRQYRTLYSRRNFLKLGGAVAGAAVLAYSGADEAVEDWHSSQVVGDTSNVMAKFLHEFGERYWFGYWAAFAVIDAYVGSTALSRWGRQSFGAMVVGLPTLWTVQRGLGGARPKDHTHGPRFLPFADDNTASGHTFIGAIPWLVLARRAGAPAPRTLAYALSPWVGWSRINDHKHYLSQVLLGYGIAWEAVATVEAVGLDETRSLPPSE
jgi:membrane-associated phospholipid phosphatase